MPGADDLAVSQRSCLRGNSLPSTAFEDRGVRYESFTVASRPPPGTRFMSDLMPELRYAVRQLARTPGFTLIALLTLAVAIGATTAVFSLANGVLLKPLGFVRPDRVVYLRGVSGSGQITAIAAQDLLDYRSQSRSFTDVVAV